MIIFVINELIKIFVITGDMISKNLQSNNICFFFFSIFLFLKIVNITFSTFL